MTFNILLIVNEKILIAIFEIVRSSFCLFGPRLAAILRVLQQMGARHKSKIILRPFLSLFCRLNFENTSVSIVSAEMSYNRFVCWLIGCYEVIWKGTSHELRARRRAIFAINSKFFLKAHLTHAHATWSAANRTYLRMII